MDTLFQIANLVALLSWLSLVIFSKNDQVIKVLKYLIIGTLSISYVVLLAPFLVHFQIDTFSSIPNIQALFANPQMLTAGWIHYLAFDLFVGIYLVQKGKEYGLARWKYTLCLPFTFMFGPMGLLLFYILSSKKILSHA